MSLWSKEEAAAATGGRAYGDWAANGLSIDTRTLQAGDLFIALKAQRDGHEFVRAALDNGAAAAMVSHLPEGVSEADNLLVVADVQSALEDLARAARVRSTARIVAITGSVGKTSTKEMLRTVLAKQGKTHASVASYNNHWGVPLTLARMPRESEYAVIEIGMNHPGEIAPLAKLTRPHVALITTVAAAHLAAFDDITGIALEKASILEGLEYGGSAVLNCDVDTSAILFSKAHDLKRKDVGFGRHGFDFKLLEARIEGEQTLVAAQVDEAPLNFTLSVPGAHFAMNALGALAAVRELGADMGQAAGDLSDWTPYQGRGVREVIQINAQGGTLELIDDSYNANPTSMEAALNVLAAAQTTGRRIAIIGDMKELGQGEAQMHGALADLPAMQSIDVVHCVGPLMAHLYKALPKARRGLHVASSEELAEKLPSTAHVGDVLMAKGSLSMRLSVVVQAIRNMAHGEPLS